MVYRSGPGLDDVVRATTVARLLYAAPAWRGFASQREKGMLQSVMNRLIRQRYLPSDSPTFEQLSLKADTCLFSAVLANPGHFSIGFSLQKSRWRIPFDPGHMTVFYL